MHTNELLKSIHDCMPVILDSQVRDLWLKGDLDAAEALLRPFPAETRER